MNNHSKFVHKRLREFFMALQRACLGNKPGCTVINKPLTIFNELFRIKPGAKLTVSTFETYGKKEFNEIKDTKNRIVTGAFAHSAKWVAEQMDVLIKSGKGNR